MNGVRHPQAGDEDRQCRMVTGAWAGKNLVVEWVRDGVVSLLSAEGFGIGEVKADRVFIFDPEDP